MMDRYGKTINYVLDIEELLEQLGAATVDLSGRPLSTHKRLSSIEHRLPDRLVKQLRYVITIRNKLMHERNFRIRDFDHYEAVCRSCIAELKRAAKRDGDHIPGRGDPSSVSLVPSSQRYASPRPVPVDNGGRDADFAMPSTGGRRFLNILGGVFAVGVVIVGALFAIALAYVAVVYILPIALLIAIIAALAGK